jgi:diacylglycerol kinase family enzyme
VSVPDRPRVYAGAWVLDRRSRHDDGVFEVVPFRGRSDWLSKGLVDLEGNLITEEMWNEIGIEHSKPIRGGKLELRLTPPESGVGLAAQIDGEEFPPLAQVTVEAIPRALRLIVPRGAAG